MVYESSSKWEEHAMTFQNPQYLVETDWLQTHLEEPNLRILDCTVYLPNYFDASAAEKVEIVSGRGNWEKGHIPGSAFVDLVQDLCDPHNTRLMFPMPTAEQFAAVMSRHGVSEGTRVVLYDDMVNIWAARVWWMLRVFGFEQAAVLNGGWQKWTREGRPISTATSTYAPASFVPRPRPELIATKGQVISAIDQQSICLINALDPDEYAGRGPVRYGRPGHIPSSVNVSFLQVLDPDTNTYQLPEQLREQFNQVGALHKDQVITYCGGGIAACSDALVLTLLGIDKVAVYDGSMTEWAADPVLPLVTAG
jgi:thiosulfate/3-mercaptopyruvate sulfurtransferase